MKAQDEMPASQSSDVTLEDEFVTSDQSSRLQLDLSGLPPIYVLTLNITVEELHKVEDDLSSHGAPLTYDIREANLVLGDISKARRAKLELQWGGVRIKDTKHERPETTSENVFKQESEYRHEKRRRLSNTQQYTEGKPKGAEEKSAISETDNEDEGTKPMSQLSLNQVPSSPAADFAGPNVATEATPLSFELGSLEGRVKVIKLEWLSESLKVGLIQPLEPYTIYEADLLASNEDQKGPAAAISPSPTKDAESLVRKPPRLEEEIAAGILERAKAEARPQNPRYQRRDRIKDIMRQEFAGRSFIAGSQSQSFTRPSKLLHQTTSEYDEGISASLPPMPDWVRENKIYSCERSTPLHPPNEAFIDQLKKIKLARVLTGDEIGVRAYSTSIASLAAYPHVLSHTNEILALPGCDHKIAHLFHEWQTSVGTLQAVRDIEADPVLTVLSLFYEIWGVGAITAREFYYDNGWRDLDDIIEHGWKSLSRVQQIGVKYYDEFQLKIPRSEVEAIAAIIHEHGKRVTDPNLECIIVGGYRRGKLESGDVDLILSHRDEAQTYNLVNRVVKSLEKSGEITHTLTMNLTNTKRDQQPLPLAPIRGGHGFDTLDKALVVWQSQDWPSRQSDLAADPKAKNPNPHRRVDIIISPWRTVGCAVQGWTSGTTFERDLRRYAKKVKGWKFDSSGVRERGTGRWMDLERWSDERTRAATWQEAERRVFEGFGLVWRKPEERGTG